MGTTFISQLTATPSRKEASSRTAESSHTGPRRSRTLKSLSAPAFCVQDVGPDMVPSTNKQTNNSGTTHGISRAWHNDRMNIFFSGPRGPCQGAG